MRNRFTFGIGTIGRDMVYSLISMYLIYYLTDILMLDDKALWWTSGIMVGCRIFDALNDPVMGVIVDNTNTRWGRFKPWILFGTVLSGIFSILLFSDLGLSSGGFIVAFGVIYLLWGVSYTTNDISYWSMLPSLSVNQKEREKIGSVARICANIGLFFVVAGIVPLTTMFGEKLGSMQKGYFAFTLLVVAIMWAGQAVTLIGVKEPSSMRKAHQEHTTLKEMVKVIVKNDQLLYTAISMVLFSVGYMATTGFGLYYFKYVYGNEDMYSIFAVILGVSQIAALVVFPALSKNHSRKSLYAFSTLLVVVGYIIFFFAPVNTMTFIGIAGVLIFVGEAFIQLMMLMFLADTVEYGNWKFGKRNDSVTFSIQPFINKMGGALGSGIVSATIIISGISQANSAADVTEKGLLIMKVAMLILPLILIAAGYIVYKKKYILDEKMYEKIIEELGRKDDDYAEQ